MTKKNNCNNPLEGVCSKDNDAEGGSEKNLLAATRRRRAEIRRIRAAVGTGFRSGSASALAPASASPDDGKIKRVRSETESSGEVDDDDSSFSSTSPPSSDSDGGAGGGGGEGSGGVAGAFASVIGRRREMEDAVTVAPGFAGGYDFYGVYDGHGGAGVAQVCRERLHVVVAEEVEEVGERWEQVMAASFAKVDEEVGKAEVGGTSVGSTAVVAVVGPGRIIVANCGDSRAVLSRGGVAVPLSIDHKPERPDELERVEAAGGRVINWYGYRILGVLATSRSIGDYHLKPYVISEPEVKVIDRNARDEFIILASDGLWDVVSNEVACKITRQCLRGRATRMFPEAINRHTAADAATLLVQLALSRGSRDNVSVVVVELKRLVGDRASRVA